MKIKNVDFIKSSKNFKDCPKINFFEYAFIGRSNVGKSSLINCLISRKNFAKTSSLPGKTRFINHYLVNNSYFFTDLPGYGYVKFSKVHKKKNKKLIIDYLLNRIQIVNIFILIDSRHFLMQIDFDFIKFLGENQLPFSIIFTKYDKVKINCFKSNFISYQKKILNIFTEPPSMFITSSQTKIGCKNILEYINCINNKTIN